MYTNGYIHYTWWVPHQYPFSVSHPWENDEEVLQSSGFGKSLKKMEEMKKKYKKKRWEWRSVWVSEYTLDTGHKAARHRGERCCEGREESTTRMETEWSTRRTKWSDDEEGRRETGKTRRRTTTTTTTTTETKKYKVRSYSPGAWGPSIPKNLHEQEWEDE